MNRFAKCLCRQELRAIGRRFDWFGPEVNEPLLACEAVVNSPQMLQVFCEHVEDEYRNRLGVNGVINLTLLAKFLRDYGPTIVRIAMLVFSMMSGREDASVYESDESYPPFQKLKVIMQDSDFKKGLADEYGQLSREAPDAAVMWMCTDDEGGVA